MLRKLPITPSPLPDEDFFGFILRTAGINGYEHVSYIYGPKGSPAYTPEAMLQITGHTCDHLLGAKNEPFHDFKGWKLADQFVRLGDTSIKVCPDCILEEGYQQAKHRLRFVFTCPRHNRWLVRSCDKCFAPLKLVRNSLLTCHQGHDLTEENRHTHSPDAMEFQEILQAVLDRTPYNKSTISSPSGFPVQDLLRLNINVFLSIVESIGTLSRTAKGCPGPHFDEMIFDDAVEVLSNWPNNFYDFLDSLHGKVHLHPRLIAPFKPYEAIGLGVYPPDQTQFLRDAYVEYLRSQWDWMEDTNKYPKHDITPDKSSAIAIYALVTGAKVESVQAAFDQGKLDGIKISWPSTPGLMHIESLPLRIDLTPLKQFETLEILGINQPTFITLSKAELIIRHYRAESHNGYYESEISSFKRRFSELVYEGSDPLPEDLTTIRDLSLQKRALQRAPAILLAGILKGNLRCYQSADRLENLVVSRDQANQTLELGQTLLINRYTKTFRIVDAEMIDALCDTTLVSFDPANYEDFLSDDHNPLIAIPYNNFI